MVSGSDGSAKLPEQVLRELENELNEKDLFADCKIDLAANFDVSAADLNHDRTPEIVVHGRGQCLCSPTGNCPLWIYHKTAAGYRRLLRADGVQRFELKTSSTSGFRDVETKRHGSAYDSEVRLYRFTGSSYELKECFEVSYSYLDSSGQVHLRKHPKKTPCRYAPE